MELIEGETLANRRVCGPIAIQEALHIATSICDALEAAHEKGIVYTKTACSGSFADAYKNAISWTGMSALKWGGIAVGNRRPQMKTDRHGSKRLPLFICVYLWLISTACAQVSFTLATKDGKSRFRVGEAIEVELRFQATESGKYGVWTTSLVRQVRRPEFDHFTVEPSTGVADPLVDSFAQMSGGGGRVPRPALCLAYPR
jgi:hypothetical protein